MYLYVFLNEGSNWEINLVLGSSMYTSQKEGMCREEKTQLIISQLGKMFA